MFWTGVYFKNSLNYCTGHLGALIILVNMSRLYVSHWFWEKCTFEVVLILIKSQEILSILKKIICEGKWVVCILTAFLLEILLINPI